MLLPLIHSQFQPDVLFANVSHTYKNRDVFTLHDMKSIYSVYSECTHMIANMMWDFKSWLENAPTIDRITKYQHFKVQQGPPLKEMTTRERLKLLRTRYTTSTVNYTIARNNTCHKLFEQKPHFKMTLALLNLCTSSYWEPRNVEPL